MIYQKILLTLTTGYTLIIVSNDGFPGQTEGKDLGIINRNQSLKLSYGIVILRNGKLVQHLQQVM
jgi:hypothetical protein